MVFVVGAAIMPEANIPFKSDVSIEVLMWLCAEVHGNSHTRLIEHLHFSVNLPVCLMNQFTDHCVVGSLCRGELSTFIVSL